MGIRWLITFCIQFPFIVVETFQTITTRGSNDPWILEPSRLISWRACTHPSLPFVPIASSCCKIAVLTTMERKKDNCLWDWQRDWKH